LYVQSGQAKKKYTKDDIM